MRNKIIFLLVILGVLGAWAAPTSTRCTEQAAAPGLQPGARSVSRRASTPTASSRASSRTARTSTSTRRSRGLVRILVTEGQAVTAGSRARADRRLRSARHRRAAEVAVRGRARRCWTSCSAAAQGEPRGRARPRSRRPGQPEDRAGPLDKQQSSYKLIRSRSARTRSTTPSTRRRSRRPISRWSRGSTTDESRRVGLTTSGIRRSSPTRSANPTGLRARCSPNTRCVRRGRHSLSRQCRVGASFRRRAHTKATRKG